MKKIIKFFIAVLFCWNAAAVAADGEPWELWRQAYNDQLQAEQFLRQDRKAEAKLMFIRARNSYVAVKDARPDWNQELINSRIALCDSEAAKLENVETARSVTVPALAREAEPSDEYKERYFKALMELDNIRKELEAAKTSSLEINALLSEKQLLQEQYSLLMDQYQDLKTNSANPSPELESLRTRLLEAQLTADNAERRRNVLADSYEELQQDYNDLIAERNTLRGEKQSLQGRLADIEKESAQSRSNISAERERSARLELELQSREAEIRELKRSVQQLAADNSAMINNLSDNKDVNSALAEEIKRYKTRYEQLELDYLNMNTENRQLSTSLRELRLEAAENGETIRNLDLLNKDLQQKNNDLAAANENLETAVRTQERSFRDLEERVSVLAEENAGLLERNASLELRLKNREEGQLALAGEYELEKRSMQETVEALRLELAAVNGRNSGLEQKLNEEIQRNNELKNEYIDIKAAHMNLSMEMDKYKAVEVRCASLEKELSGAVAQCNEYSTRIGELEAAVAAQTAAAQAAALAAAEVQATAAAPADIIPAGVSAVLPQPSTAADSGKTAKHLAAARKAVQDDFLELAVLEYQRVLNAEPDHPDANRELGELYVADGRPEEALPYLKKISDLMPEDIDSRKRYIIAAAAAGRDNEVLTLIGAMPPEVQQDRELLYARGKALALLNRWEEAAEIYGMPVLNEAPSAQMLMEYTRILAALDRNEEAVAVYEKARAAGAQADAAVESTLGIKSDANRDLCEFFESACNEAFAAGNWESVIWYSLKLIGMDADNPAYYFDWIYAALMLDRGNEAGAAAAQAAVRCRSTGNELQMRLLLAGAADLMNENPAAAAKSFREAAAVAGSMENSSGTMAVDDRYSGIASVIRRLLEKLSRQPSVSRSDINDAVAGFEALGI